MTEDDRTGNSSASTADRVAVLSPVAPREHRRRALFRRRRGRTRRIRWLRLLGILVPLSFLALISTVFGMVLAFEPQLAPLVSKLNDTYKNGLNSIIYTNSYDTHEIGILTSKNRFLLRADEIPLLMDHAIVAIEDKRFYTESGVDIRGIARAFVEDVFHSGGGTQGASTITEQFIKQALNEAGHRTLFEKLKEAALAYQLSHLWSKAKILAEYLNTAYFGNGAYGIEAAARAYFGNDPSSNLYECGTAPNNQDPASLCVTDLTADEAALLAGLVNAPTTLGYDLFADPQAVYDRRNRVLKDMLAQGYLTQSEYQTDLLQSLPPAADVQSPSEEDVDPSAGYFAQWIESQLVAKYHSAIYSDGYHVHTTLDYELQYRAQRVVDSALPPGSGGPTAALVAINNATGDVTAMVGGYDFSANGFNLATQAERQPGSSFKVFDLAVALEQGYSPNYEILSDPLRYNAGIYGEVDVHNDEHSYFGVKIPLWEALAYSDNSVFARLGLLIGTTPVAQLAHTFGITTTISHNPSMVIGGLHIGVTPLDMAHAYETIANGGELETGTLASNACAGGGTKAYAWEEQYPPVTTGCPGPNGIDFIVENHKTVKNASYQDATGFPYSDDQKEIDMMRDVITFGTGTAAAIPGVEAWGKTGTTSNYVDAWFVGSTPTMGPVPSMTVAVWVGYPNSARSMATDYGGKPVYGGTYPAVIWRNFIQQAIQQYKLEAARPTAAHGSKSAGTGEPTGGTAIGATGDTGASNNPAAGHSTSPPASGPTTPAAGTVTSGGGSSAPSSTAPAGGTATPAGGAGTTSPATSKPPATTTGGGVAAPGGGTAAPS